MDAKAELTPLLPAFKVGVLPTLLALDPRNVARVKNEPALSLGNEPGVGSLQLCLANGFGHGRILAGAMRGELASGPGVNSFQVPSETTSTAPSATLIAV